ncbi:MAG: ABC transporter ATP-binding protein [Sporichthyaceae bacterium]|nr:ABC transporter ATP-binding protein [Sporichthyaceae bacterium]
MDRATAHRASFRSYSRDDSVRDHKLAPGTIRRILGFAAPFRRQILIFLGVVITTSVLVVVSPLLLKSLIDDGVLPGDRGVVTRLALLVAAVAVLEAVLSLFQRWYSSRIGEGLIYDLRTKVYDHVQRQPVAFFTRTETGSLVSRLNNDVIGAQQAFTSTLSGAVSNVFSLIMVGGAMALLSWQLTLTALVLVPLFLVPAKYVGRRMQGLVRQQMQGNAELGSTMTERFNVAGALLVKLYGRPDDESRLFATRASVVRDLSVRIAMVGRFFFTAMALTASLATALVYGLGGQLAISQQLTVGSLLALTALLGRLYGPITALSNIRVDVMSALVSFERVFEVLDLEPTVAERPGATVLRNARPAVAFDHVAFRYPTASEVSLASLESVADHARPETVPEDVLHDVTFSAAPGEMIALVGPSGAGKTTITHLVSRMYDVGSGAVRIGGVDVRDLTLESLHDAVGVVTQDAHMFHDSIRQNLLLAKPAATLEDMEHALRAAAIWDLIDSLPEGLDTIVGDRGYRLSGGEKQRLAIARLLLKSPGVVVLDEATAHLDSESEAAVQRALAAALVGRTSIVIAHRLSTVREADRILVISDGRVVEHGKHAELLAAGGLYADLYRTQFAHQAA